MNQLSDRFSTKQLIGLMALAYAFSFLIRMIWVYQFYGNPQFMWNDQLMINTNDGYFFASGVQEALSGLHHDNPRMPSFWAYGTVFLTTLFVKFTPFSLETVTLYMPAVISSLVVIPMILIARLYGQTLWGFFAALLGSITWSYYNRTMVGYYDTDMFSAMAPMLILFFLLKSTLDLELKSMLYGGIAIILYPFFYDQGESIIYAMGLMYGLYMMLFHREKKESYGLLALLFFALIPMKFLAPWGYLLHIGLLVGFYMLLRQNRLDERRVMLTAGVMFGLFLLFGNVFGLIWHKIVSYTIEGTANAGELHYYAVNQTVREAGHIPFSTFAHRTAGSVIGVWIALIGYLLLVIKRPAFLIALPLMGIGIFSLWGGLRFTVYAVPVAALGAVYLFWVVSEKFIEKAPLRYGVVALLTALMIVPNIQHIINYKISTVFNHTEVENLVKLNEQASGKDYTIAWWDYGYPLWYYSDTSTLIDGGKHNNDNFIVSKIMQTTSPKLAANLSRLAVETYVSNGYKTITKTLFEGKDPNALLDSLADGSYPLPAKSRDVFLYMPYRMLDIFPTVALFGNLDLTTGKRLRPFKFYTLRAVSSSKDGRITFSNGLIFDAKKGLLRLPRSTQKIKRFVVTQNRKGGKIKLESQFYHSDGEYVMVYMKSYGKFVLMDSETFHSMYVQMFILGRYDTSLFELVEASPYSRIYKLK